MFLIKKRSDGYLVCVPIDKELNPETIEGAVATVKSKAIALAFIEGAIFGRYDTVFPDALENKNKFTR